MDNFQTKLAVMGPGLVKWYFKIHVQVYLYMWHEWPAFILSAEKCTPGTSLVGFLSVCLFVCLLFSAMKLLFRTGHGV